MTATHLIDSLGWTLLHFTWQGALIGGITAALLGMMGNARAQHRYVLACSAMLACLIWPLVEFIGRLGVAPGNNQSTLIFSTLDSLVNFKQGAGATVSQQLQSKLVIIVGIWALCAAGLTLRLGLGLLWIEQIGQRAGQAASPEWQARIARMAEQFSIGRTVQLRIVDQLASPITAGWWKPVILMPASLMSGMPPDLLDALLAHELGHIKRHDYVINLIQNAIEVVLFYHPAVWWISRQVRNEREAIADDLAARQLGEPRRLALALSELEKFQFSTHHLAQAANGGDLMSRIKRLVRPETQGSNWKAVIPVLALTSLTLAACTSIAPSKELAASVMVHPVASFKSCAKPEWPVASLRKEETGTVTLKFEISETGQVLDSAIKNSSGHPDLDQAARIGIQKCTFIPGTIDGKPSRMWMQMQYVWMLKDPEVKT
jgi:bla regulator protein BlaR1